VNVLWLKEKTECAAPRAAVAGRADKGHEFRGPRHGVKAVEWCELEVGSD
jgi:hypothetical protein